MTTIKTLLSSESGATSLTDINNNFSAINNGKAEVGGQVFTGNVSASNLSGTNTGDQTLNSLLPNQSGHATQFLTTDGSNASWSAVAGGSGGTVTTFSIASGNGLSGSVTNPTATPQLTLSTYITGIVKANGTAFSAATAETDYVTPTGAGTLANKTLTKPVLNARDQTAQTYTPTAGGTATLNLLLSDTHFIQMPAGNITIALSNDINNQAFEVDITQDSVGSRIVTWFPGIAWVNGGTQPNLTTTANKTDTFGFRRLGSASYRGFVMGQNS